jgi:hypothetical protein
MRFAEGSPRAVDADDDVEHPPVAAGDARAAHLPRWKGGGGAPPATTEHPSACMQAMVGDALNRDTDSHSARASSCQANRAPRQPRQAQGRPGWAAPGGPFRWLGEEGPRWDGQ